MPVPVKNLITVVEDIVFIISEEEEDDLGSYMAISASSSLHWGALW